MYCMHICAMLTHKSRPMIDSKSETPLLKMQSRDFPIVPFQTLRSINVKCVCEWLPVDYWLYFFAAFHLLRKVPAFERRNKKMCHNCLLLQKTDNLRRFCIWLVRKWESEISSFLGFCLWREKYLKKIIWERFWQNWIWSVSVYLFLLPLKGCSPLFLKH